MNHLTCEVRLCRSLARLAGPFYVSSHYMTQLKMSVKENRTERENICSWLEIGRSFALDFTRTLHTFSFRCSPCFSSHGRTFTGTPSVNGEGRENFSARREAGCC